MVVNRHLSESSLKDIALKVAKGVRLEDEDALRLYRTRDFHALAALANFAKERRHGNQVFYNRNLHIDYSNLCHTGCTFCVYSRREGQEGAFSLTHDEIEAKAREAVRQDRVTELHIVGGLNPSHSLDWYENLLSRLRSAVPGVHLKCFTAVEIHYFAKKSGLTPEAVLSRLKDAGLNSLPGGGAEIFHPDVRKRLCPDKADAEEWGTVHRAAHRLGMKTTATMLYGHIETYAQRVDHLRRLREWQDETGGFQCFVPLSYHRDRPGMPEPSFRGGAEDLRNFAVSRLYLDNFPHLKAYWIMLGLSLSQIALSFGVDDMDGTVMEERIFHMTGAETPESLTGRELEDLVRSAGRVPVERDSLYREVRSAAR